jgi:hypothetical protein
LRTLLRRIRRQFNLLQNCGGCPRVSFFSREARPLWTFAAGGELFAYQSGVLIVSYSYGYFAARDLMIMGAWLTIVEFLVLLVLVPVYWPLIGLQQARGAGGRYPPTPASVPQWGGGATRTGQR